MNRTAIVQFLRTHRLVIIIIAMLILTWSIASVVVWQRSEEQLAKSEASARTQSEETEALIRKLKQEHDAEEKRLADEKAKQEADEAAKKKAEEEAAVTRPQQTVTPPAGGSCNTASSHKNPAAIDVLVNKKHCLVPLSFVPNVVSAQGGATISSVALQDYNRMFNDAASAGQPFWVSSSYRSYATQVSTYNHWVSVNGQAVADTVSARPGYSEHQTGLAIDVAAGDRTLNNFAGTSQYHWFQANAANYGFIQRYYAGYEAITGYASEEWHYRYVGVAAAQDMKARGIKTLEQYWGMEGGNYR